MSVVKINVLSVPAERHEEIEGRFTARAGEVGRQPGFEAFELLRPTEGFDRYLVYTRWESEEAFRAWQQSRAFGEGHKSTAQGGPVAQQAELWSFDVVQSERTGS